MDIPAAVRGSPVPLCMHADSPVRKRGGRPSPRKAARTDVYKRQLSAPRRAAVAP